LTNSETIGHHKDGSLSAMILPLLFL